MFSCLDQKDSATDAHFATPSLCASDESLPGLSIGLPDCLSPAELSHGSEFGSNLYYMNALFNETGRIMLGFPLEVETSLHPAMLFSLMQREGIVHTSWKVSHLCSLVWYPHSWLKHGQKVRLHWDKVLHQEVSKDKDMRGQRVVWLNRKLSPCQPVLSGTWENLIPKIRVPRASNSANFPFWTFKTSTTHPGPGLGYSMKQKKKSEKWCQRSDQNTKLIRIQ